MSERKIRRIAILAGVLCIILSIVLTYAVFEITSLNDIANLRKSETWVEDTFTLKPNYEIDLDFKAPYAGYVLINLLGSSSVTVHVRYTAYGIDHDFKTNGNAAFPILPNNIRIALVNLDANSNATATLTAKYFY